MVKVGALVFVLVLDRTAAINFQLLGGIWILQTFPAIVFGLFTRWFHRWALLAGWAVGMVYGTWTAYNQLNPVTQAHFGSPLADVPIFGGRAYIALTAFVLNLVVAAVLTVVLKAMSVPDGVDQTEAMDFLADAGDPRVSDLAERSGEQPVGRPDDPRGRRG